MNDPYIVIGEFSQLDLSKSATRVAALAAKHEWQCVYSEYTGISSLMELIPYIYSVNFEIAACKEFPCYCYDTPIQLQFDSAKLFCYAKLM